MPTKESIKAVAGKKYVMFPLYYDNFQTLEGYYTKGKDMLKNPKDYENGMLFEDFIEEFENENV